MEGSEASTRAAIERSKQFLESKLKPDLDEAISFQRHLENTRNDFQELRNDIEIMRRSEPQIESVEKDSNALLAHLGYGVHLPATVESGALLIVSSGLRSSPQDWQSDSGLYLQLTEVETIDFAESKIAILDRRIKLAKERVTLIQNHSELTTQSIAHLEQLLI